MATTLALVVHAGTVTTTGWIVMIAGALLGGGAGLYAARTVEMTAMPQLVSIFNAVGGGAAALVGDPRLRHGSPRGASPSPPRSSPSWTC